MERDNATFQDKGTEISSLSRDKGTTGQFCQGTGQDRCQNPGQEGTQDESDFDRQSDNGCIFFTASQTVLSFWN